MNQDLDATPRTLREAFYTMTTAQGVPDAKLLDDVVRQFPQFSEELTQFAIAVAIDALRGDCAADAAEAAIDPGVVSAAVSRAMSHFQNRLHGMSAVASQDYGGRAKIADVPNPFLRLQRNEFRALAARLNANTVFVGKLRDRQIYPATMTSGFRERVADELRAPLELVVAHFAARQNASGAQFFKAEEKPSVGVLQTFEEAVKSSGLTEAQQKSLLEL